MKIALLTASISAGSSGIADHSINFVNALGSCGESLIVVAGSGGRVPEHIEVVECDWDSIGFEVLFQKLELLELDCLVLQFTPLMYISKNCNVHDLVNFWKRCGQIWKTSIIVHETYFRVWWYPKSWINGLKEKRLLTNMVELSNSVFSASLPLVDEMKKWRNDGKAQLLPIGSNFQFVDTNIDLARSYLGIAPKSIMLVLFGGGNSLKWMRNHVIVTDELLHSNGISAHWLMLGGIPSSWFDLKLPVISPGKLSEQQISIWLQASNIFLMPHYAGLCAKRGTLMAAMQHALPVVGTRTEMTDSFLNNIEGIRLTSRRAVNEFSQQVLALAIDKQLRVRLGKLNQEYFRSNFEWPIIARHFLTEIKK